MLASLKESVSFEAHSSADYFYRSCGNPVIFRILTFKVDNFGVQGLYGSICVYSFPFSYSKHSVIFHS